MEGPASRASQHRAKAVTAATPAAFINEELVYRIGFWYFEDVATGSVMLKKDENGDGNDYVATLAAQTKEGFLAWLLRYRKDRYTARLRLSGDGKRFLTKTFDKTIDIGGRLRYSHTEIDYESRVMKWKSWGAGREEKSGEVKIPPGIFADDPLAAFYNFRAGVYGDVAEGREYKIPTFPKEDRVPEITLRIVTREEFEKRLPEKKSRADFLADVRIDKELFGQKAGDIEIIFNDDLLPVEAVAKDIALFGDVRGKISEITSEVEFQKGPEAPARTAP